MFDIIIHDGKLIDGTCNGWIRADIGIQDGRIVEIGRLSLENADQSISAEGQVVCPGFIDIHTHSDFSLAINRSAETSVRQGITTEVIGNCGNSGYPGIPTKEEANGLQIYTGNHEDYLSFLAELTYSVNVVPMIGHGSLRKTVMGFENRKPTDDELDKMKQLLEQYLDQGVFGITTGLIYSPGCYAETGELIELSSVVSVHNGIYATHVRGEGDTVEEAIKETIEISRSASIPVHISHLKAAGFKNWGKIPNILAVLDEARANNIGVTCDFYPYLSGCTWLLALLPPWLLENKGVPGMIDLLKKHDVRKRVREEIEDDLVSGWWNPVKTAGGWNKVTVAGVHNQLIKWCQGATISEIADNNDKDAYDVAFDLLISDEGRVNVTIEMMSEDDLIMIMKYPHAAIGSDGSSEGKVELVGNVHPRSFGTFPRLLGRYVREQNILQLEDAIRKMTSLPAQILGLHDRGLIKKGMVADIVIFNPDTIIDNNTCLEPKKAPSGINYVLVNGEIVINQCKHTGEFPGRLLLN